MDINALSLIVNSLLVILGWVFSARWAVKQVNIAHQKNQELQAELLKQSMKDKLYKEFVTIHVETMESINQLYYKINEVGLNMSCDEHKPDRTIVFGWRDAIGRINDAYATLGRNIDRLEIWLDASGDFLTSSNLVYDLISDYRTNFAAQANGSAWIQFQANIAGILRDNRPDTKRYGANSQPVIAALIGLKSKLKESAKVAQRYLLTREEIEFKVE